MLAALVTTSAQENKSLARHCVIHPVARPPIKPQLPDTLTYRLAVTKVAVVQPNQPSGNPSLCLSILQAIKPTPKKVLTLGATVMSKFVHKIIVAFELQKSNSNAYSRVLPLDLSLPRQAQQPTWRKA